MTSDEHMPGCPMPCHACLARDLGTKGRAASAAQRERDAQAVERLVDNFTDKRVRAVLRDAAELIRRGGET